MSYIKTFDQFQPNDIKYQGCCSNKFSEFLEPRKGDFLRFICRFIWYQNHFTSNENVFWGAYNDHFLMPEKFALMGLKILKVKICRKQQFCEKFWLERSKWEVVDKLLCTTSHSDLSNSIISQKNFFWSFSLKIFLPIKAKLLGIKSWLL